MSWDHPTVYQALVERGRRVKSSSLNRYVTLYDQRKNCAVLYGPDSRDFKNKPFHTNDSRPEWKADLFVRLKSVIEKVSEDRHKGTNNFVHYRVKDWTRFADAVGLTKDTAGSSRAKRLAEDVKLHEPGNPEMEKLRVSVEEELDEQGEFDPTGIEDARKRTIRGTVLRQGQPLFRKKLLKAFGGRCAITGCSVEPVLEAAHIIPYQGEKTNHLSNGILLRADFHTLFDLHLVTINEDTMKLVVSSTLNGTEYEKYRNKKVRIPKVTSREALEQHRTESGLG